MITTNAPLVTTNLSSINTNSTVAGTNVVSTPVFNGSFVGNGSGLTNLNAAQIAGALALGQLPAAVVTNGESGVVLSGTFNGNGAGLTNLSVLGGSADGHDFTGAIARRSRDKQRDRSHCNRNFQRHFCLSDGNGLTNVGVASGVPAGSIMAYMGTAAAAGWLVCDGSAVSRTAYAGLFAILSTSCGQGDGSTTFNLPDTRGLFLRGLNGSRSDTNYFDPDSAARTNAYAGGNVGDNIGSLQTDQLRSHQHSNGGQPLGSAVAQGVFGSPAATGNTGFTGGNETRPKNMYVNYIIKY